MSLVLRNVEAKFNAIINTCTTGNSSVQPNNRPGSMNTSIRDANGSKEATPKRTNKRKRANTDGAMTKEVNKPTNHATNNNKPPSALLPQHDHASCVASRGW